MGYGAAGVRDVVQNGRQDGQPSWILQKIKFIGKTRKLQN